MLDGNQIQARCEGVRISLVQAAKVFFFSSRRRHTRLQGDWSSDVCSSDLGCCEIALQTDNAKTNSIPSTNLRQSRFGRRDWAHTACGFRVAFINAEWLSCRPSDRCIPSSSTYMSSSLIVRLERCA